MNEEIVAIRKIVVLMKDSPGLGMELNKVSHIPWWKSVLVWNMDGRSCGSMLKKLYPSDAKWIFDKWVDSDIEEYDKFIVQTARNYCGSLKIKEWQSLVQQT